MWSGSAGISRAIALGLTLLALLGAGPEAFRRGEHGGRSFRLYVPTGNAAGAPRPLVVALHGCAQTPEDFAAGTRLNEVAEARNLLALYPRQTPGHNPARCWNWLVPGRGTEGEPAQLLALIDHVHRTYPVDPERVVVLGFSAGAFMAVKLQCLAPDVIGGIGVMAGGPYRCGEGLVGSIECMRGVHLDGKAAAAACLAAMGRERRAIRASLWQGTEDSVVSPANLDALTTMLATIAGVDRGRTEPRDGAIHVTWSDARGRALFESWLVSEMGHAWSGGEERGTQTYPAGPRATDLMLDFLLPGN